MTSLAKIRLGTRKSALALAQAHEVVSLLQQAWPGMQVEIVPMMTSGDAFVGKPLSDIGGKGLFTKEIEEALLNGNVDIAVHSMKDMPTVLPQGLVMGALLKRENPCDMLVGHGISSLEDIPVGASFGTSSLRRSAQLLMVRPDINIVPLRGNVGTRLKKLEAGEMHATMLAVAGLRRLGLKDIPGAQLSIEQFLPAVAQGAIGIECRANDAKMLDALKPLAHHDTEVAVACERAFLKALDGSCRTPIAGYAQVKGGHVIFNGLIVKPDGTAHHKIDATGNAADGERIGRDAGEELKARAGANFLN